MAIGNVIVNVVDVGQGQCTFVEINDTSGKLINTLLFDCGSNHHSTQQDTNLNSIANKIAGMDIPAFDCIFFSHGDTDHTNLTITLLKKIEVLLTGTGKSLVVKEVWYGGDWEDYTKNEENPLDYIEEHYTHADAIMSPKPNYTGYSILTDSFNEYLWEINDFEVEVVALGANVLPDEPSKKRKRKGGTPAPILNRVSLVCGLYYKNTSYVICGDATFATMGVINTKIVSPTSVFNNNIMTTIPHHGSRRTAFNEDSSSDTSQLKAKETTNTFSKLLKSKTLTVSAYELHNHPSITLLNYFPPTVTNPMIYDTRIDGQKTHLLSAYFDNEMKLPDGSVIAGDKTFETNSNFFSTNYYKGVIGFSYQIGAITVGAALPFTPSTVAINPFACWKYTTNSSGVTSIEGVPNLNQPKFIAVTTNSLAINNNTRRNQVQTRKKSIQKNFKVVYSLSQFKTSVKSFS